MGLRFNLFRLSQLSGQSTRVVRSAMYRADLGDQAADNLGLVLILLEPCPKLTSLRGNDR